MENNVYEVPRWLLEELLLINGAFTDETRTAVMGRPTPYLQTILNRDTEGPKVYTVRLNEERKRRLADANGRLFVGQLITRSSELEFG